MKNFKLWGQSDARGYGAPTIMSILICKPDLGLRLLCVLVTLNCSFSECFPQSGLYRNGDTLTICFISDTQEPMFFERLFLTYNKNALARKLIFERIYELNPLSVFHLGDLVSAGSNADSWGEIDTFVRKLHDMKIAFSPIPGNHEYYFSSKKGTSHFTSRYPSAKVTGYSKRYANVAVVLVNSNFSRLSEDEMRAQLRWYQNTLIEYESDPLIDFVIVGCHHSPFTNSRIVSGSRKVRDYLVSEYYRFKKCRLFLTGHAHAFEHFRMNGKDFFVTGGGGGLQHPLDTGKSAEYQDIFSDSQEKRMFHFLTIRAYDDTLTVELNMLRNDFSGFDIIPQLILTRNRSLEKESKE